MALPSARSQSMPSSLCRWFFGGSPPRGQSAIRNGAKIPHSSWVISPRSVVGLRFTKRPVKTGRMPAH